MMMKQMDHTITFNHLLVKSHHNDAEYVSLEKTKKSLIKPYRDIERRNNPAPVKRSGVVVL